MPEQLPEELSREKVPGALSKAPNINGSAPPRVRSYIGLGNLIQARWYFGFRTRIRTQNDHNLAKSKNFLN